MVIDPSFAQLKKLCDNGKLDDALDALAAHTAPTNVTDLSNIFYSLLQGCICSKNLVTGRRIYCQIVRRNLDAVSYVGSHLIRMFAACKKLPDANRVFDRLPKPNLFAWNEIILAHVGLGCSKQALYLHNQMQLSSVKADTHILVSVLKACASIEDLKQGRLIHSNTIEFCVEPGFFVGSALIDMYAKCGSMKDAQIVFDRLRRRNAVIWSAMIAGYVKYGHSSEAFCLYKRMHEDGVIPDLVTLVSILKACSISGALQEGKLIHAQSIEGSFVMDAALGNSLLDMYASCESHAEACNIFDTLTKRDVVSWSSMIESYARHRDHELALTLFEVMLKKGLRPDDVAFLCILSACSQLGVVESGCSHFNALVQKYGMLPRRDHFNCMVDLLGRAGSLIEAEDLLRTMPYHENVVGWRSLLSHRKSYSIEGHGHVSQMDCEGESLGGTTMSDAFVSHSSFMMNVTEFEGVRGPMRATKLPREAMITVRKDVHVFNVANEDHVKSLQLNNKIIRLFAQMKIQGYSPRLESVLQN